jgi:hypothetical protein
MKNNSYPALLRTSYLSNETIKRTQNSHETIPLNLLVHKIVLTTTILFYSVAEPHHFYAAPALGKNFDAAPAPAPAPPTPAPIPPLTEPTFLKQAEVNIRVRAIFLLIYIS